LNFDVKVNLIEEDVVIKSYNAHKFILFRSKHFEGIKMQINPIAIVGIMEIMEQKRKLNTNSMKMEFTSSKEN
jgi:hypothetical protein